MTNKIITLIIISNEAINVSSQSLGFIKRSVEWIVSHIGVDSSTEGMNCHYKSGVTVRSRMYTIVRIRYQRRGEISDAETSRDA